MRNKNNYSQSIPRQRMWSYCQEHLAASQRKLPKGELTGPTEPDLPGLRSPSLPAHVWAWAFANYVWAEKVPPHYRKWLLDLRVWFVNLKGKEAKKEERKKKKKKKGQAVTRSNYPERTSCSLILSHRRVKVQAGTAKWFANLISVFGNTLTINSYFEKGDRGKNKHDTYKSVFSRESSCPLLQWN